MLVQGYVTVFLHLRDLVSKRKPQGYYAKLRRLGERRARHIPTQTDTVVRFAPEHVVLFLCLAYVSNTERHLFLAKMAF